jgi:hypothetical protein
MTTKLAILGSCVSEDWVHFQDARRRLDVRLVPKYQPSSLISVTSRPLDLAIEPGSLLKPEEALALKVDIDKSFLPRLAVVQPDILIVELLTDSRRSLGVISVGDSWITNSYILQRCSLPQEVKNGRYLNVMDHEDEYMAVFRESIMKFREFMIRNLPNCRVVLNQARWAEYFIDATGELNSYPPLEQLSSFRANLRLKLLEDCFADEIACERISVDDVPIFADDQHIWGAANDHFARVYYTRFAEKLGMLIARDKQISQEPGVSGRSEIHHSTSTR